MHSGWALLLWARKHGEKLVEPWLAARVFFSTNNGANEKARGRWLVNFSFGPKLWQTSFLKPEKPH